MKKQKLFVYMALTVFSTVCIAIGCKKENEGGTNNNNNNGSTSTAVNASVVANPSFQTNIAPIFSKYCVRCHGSSGASGGIQLATFAQISTNASAALSSIQAGRMPQGGAKLAASDITTLQNWITQGKQNN